MAWWKPPWKRETRSGAYTDAYTALIIRQASGSTAPGGQAALTAYAEAAAGAWARAGMGAKVTPGDAPMAISPRFLARVFRDLVVVGESLHLIVVGRGGLRLDPISSWDVRGYGTDPGSWTYEIHRDGPSGTLSSTVSSGAVLHVMYSTDTKRVWKGVGPIERGGETSDLLSALSVRLREEASASSAVVLPVPENPDDDGDGDGRPDPTQALAADLAKAKGGVVLSETLSGGHGDRGGAPQQDWAARRIGSMIPEHYRDLLDTVGLVVCNAMGVPAALVDPGADGTAQREGWRRFAHGAVAPVARLVEQEIMEKLEVSVTLDFSELYASDVVGRASAFQRLVAGGMEVEKAAGLSGLIGDG